MRFVDTNILLYGVSTSADERTKTDTARQILVSDDLALSAQVLQEFYAQATRVTRPDPLSHEQASQLVEAFCRFPVQAITAEIVEAAMACKERYQLSYWDAAILEAARTMRCDVVLSEDLNSGQNYGGVRVINPFVEET